MPQDCRTGRCLEVDNMRILVLGFSKMKYMPYASFYIDRIDCNINEVEVLYWNRDRKEENLNR